MSLLIYIRRTWLPFHQDSFPPRSTMHRVSISLSVCVWVSEQMIFIEMF